VGKWAWLANPPVVVMVRGVGSWWAVVQHNRVLTVVGL